MVLAMDVIEAYLFGMGQVIAEIDRSAVRQAVDTLYDAWLRRATTYLIGNGGSASTASHMMNDLSKFTSFEGVPRFRAIALTDNVPLMTAVGNDLDYADVFVEPLRNLLQPGDVLVAISGSGNSPNVVRAAEYARQTGATVLALCGTPGGKLALLAHTAIRVPSTLIGQQEDGHLILNHTIASALRARIGAGLSVGAAV